jgi:Isoleucyl-tRNA synthetase
VARLTEAYRKLRNTFRYALGNLADFNPETDALPEAELLEIDQWILYATRDLVEECVEHYSQFGFHRLYRRVYDFATTDLSAIYLT